MDAEQIKTLLDMRMAKYPDHACLMQELTFKDEKIAALEAENARLSRIVRAAEKWAKAVRFEEEATSGKRCVPIKTQLDAQDWVTEAEDALLEAVEGGRSDED